MTILLRFVAPALTAAALTAAPLAVFAQAKPEAGPNVIVFVGDDLGWRDTGPYGNPYVRTPNIDRLARSGLRVEYAFGTTPQCSPSRISTLTGRRCGPRGSSARAKAGRLTPAQRRLLEAPRARLELYDLAAYPWELRNVADDQAYAKTVRELAGVLQDWMEQSADFPAAYRVRDDNTDRITGVPFSTKIPPLRNADVPPPGERWGRQGPT